MCLVPGCGKDHAWKPGDELPEDQIRRLRDSVQTEITRLRGELERLRGAALDALTREE